MKRLLLALSLVLIIAGAFSACSGNGSGTLEKQAEEISVFAAASLTESFTELAEKFEAEENGKVKVVFNFAGSQALKTSIEAGIKTDIFASANIKYMDELKDKGFVNSYDIFLKNRLTIILNRNSKYSIGSLQDLAADGVSIAVGDKSVPVGAYWEEAFDSAVNKGIITGAQKDLINNNIKTRELNVKDVVSKVLLNEVDAGVVYRTDVTDTVTDKVIQVEIPFFEGFDAIYPIAVLKNSEERDEVRKLYEYIISEKGKEVFGKYGFVTES